MLKNILTEDNENHRCRYLRRRGDLKLQWLLWGVFVIEMIALMRSVRTVLRRLESRIIALRRYVVERIPLRKFEVTITVLRRSVAVGTVLRKIRSWWDLCWGYLYELRWGQFVAVETTLRRSEVAMAAFRNISRCGNSADEIYNWENWSWQ